MDHLNGIDEGLSQEQKDSMDALAGNFKKGHWLANRMSFFGVSMEIGGVIYIAWGLFSGESSKIIAGVFGGLLGLFLTYIGFRIQKRITFNKFGGNPQIYERRGH